MAERKVRQEMEKCLWEMEAALASERMQKGHNLKNQELGTQSTAAAGRHTITSPRINEEDPNLYCSLNLGSTSGLKLLPLKKRQELIVPPLLYHIDSQRLPMLPLLHLSSRRQ